MAKLLSVSELNALLPRLRATIEAAEQLEQLKTQLSKSLSLESGSFHAPRKTAAAATPKPKGKGRGGNKFATAKTLRENIVKYLSGKKGVAVRDIAGALSVAPDAVRYGLAQLRTQKKVKMTGKFADALWHSA